MHEPFLVDSRGETARGRIALLAWAAVAAAFLTISLGGLVTSTGSGLATQDWPFPEGKVFPAMSGTLLIEHGHRLVAMTTGLLTLVLALCLLAERRRFVRRLGIAGLALVSLQGLLGMLTVRMKLSPEVSILHAATAQLTIAVLVLLALRLQAPRIERTLRGPATLPFQACSLAVFLQIVLGAWYRHTNVPVALGLHILGAAAAVFAVGAAWNIAGGHGLRNAAILPLAALTLQLILGPVALALTPGKQVLDSPSPLLPAAVITLHAVAGSLLWAGMVVLTWRSRVPVVASSSIRTLAVEATA